MDNRTQHEQDVAKENRSAAKVELGSIGPTTTPSNEPILQFFASGQLPEALRAVSHPFGVLAMQIFENLPRNPERTVALRKLLEAREAALRALLFK